MPRCARVDIPRGVTNHAGIFVTLGHNMKNLGGSFTITLLVAAALMLGACATGQPVSGPTAPNQKSGAEISNALPITDIPIPAGAKMDTENSLIMGAQDRWLGRIVIKADSSSGDAYKHYYNGMPSFGWELVTAVQARISTLTYVRSERVATIQIEPSTLGGATISIMVSPREIRNKEPVRQKPS